MYSFSEHSRVELLSCHEDLQTICWKAIALMDFKVLQGRRTNEEQAKLFADGKSQKKAGESWHNTTPSRAVDLAPYPIDWSDSARFILLGGIMLGIASKLDIGLRWGGDWDRDGNMRDQKFNDLGHFELVG